MSRVARNIEDRGVMTRRRMGYRKGARVPTPMMEVTVAIRDTMVLRNIVRVRRRGGRRRISYQDDSDEVDGTMMRDVATQTRQL